MDFERTAAHACKSLGHKYDFEVGLAALGHVVTARLVEHFKVLREKMVGELGAHRLLHSSSEIGHVSSHYSSVKLRKYERTRIRFLL